MSKAYISLYQRDIRQKLPEPGEPEYEFIIQALNDSETFIFPEYFCFHQELKEQEDFVTASLQAQQWLIDLSRRPEAQGTMLIGGSLLRLDNGAAYNATPLLFEGRELGFYYKRRLFGHEKGHVRRGRKPLLVTHPETGKSWGFLICADVFLWRAFSAYRRADYVAAPTSSPFRPNDDEGERLKRDRKFYQKGARKSSTVVFKCCSVGQVGSSLPERPAPRLQGRSSITTPTTTLIRAPGIYWTGLLRFEVDNAAVSQIHRNTIEPHAVT